MMTYMITQSLDHAERLARMIIALSGAAVIVWAVVRWPLTVLLKAALLAAVRATLRDDEAHASMVRLLRAELLASELKLLDETVARVDALEQPRRRHGA